MKIKGKKILITGGAGFIGSHLTDALSKENKIIVADDFSIGVEENLRESIKNGNVKIVKVNISNFKKINKIMKNVDVVFHLAVQCIRKCFKDPFIVNEVNATGSLNLYQAAVNNNVKRFTYISSSEVYGTAIDVPMTEDHPLNPTTIYGSSKLVGELYGISYWNAHKLPIIIIRPFNTYGPRSHFEGAYGEVIPRFTIQAMNNKSPIIFGDGKQTRDFTYIEDTVRGIILAAENDSLIGGVVNIAYGKERNINDVAKIILKKLKKEHLKVIHKENRPADVRRHYADISKARKTLNFKPRIALEEGINKYINFLNNQKIDIKKALKTVKKRNW